MISRWCISAALTALMLACPLLECGECCGIRIGHAGAPAQSECRAHESCCDHPAQHDGLPSPCDHSRQQQSGGNDCLCKGAIVPSLARSPDQDRDSMFLALAVVDQSIDAQLAGRHASERSRCSGSHFPPLLSGRDICTLVESYLL